ncbi:MAG: hypothetical protein JW719_10775 [Pirellulales bacterium]|nr:hypothetical protein [Pirellulales bacterium]
MRIPWARIRGRWWLWPMVMIVIVGCASPMAPRPTLPDRQEFTRDQLVFHTNGSLPAHHRLVAELAGRRVDLSQDLMLPVSDEPIHVYVFEDARAFNEFVGIHHPDLPRRRAFFLENDTRLAVYTQWGDRVAEDLRHEITHAYLHSVIPNLRLWLDEGLAEYYELPRGCRGVNRPHVDLLVKRLAEDTWRPDLPRLESLETTAVLTQVDYAECWAWIHLMLDGDSSRREILREHLRELCSTGRASPLSERLRAAGGDPNQELVFRLRRLSASDREG